MQGDCRTSRIPRALPWADISLAFQAVLQKASSAQVENDYPHLSVKDELRCTLYISLQIGLVLRLYVVVTSRSCVSNIRPNGRANGLVGTDFMSSYPYSNPALLELSGIACGKMRIIM